MTKRYPLNAALRARIRLGEPFVLVRCGKYYKQCLCSVIDSHGSGSGLHYNLQFEALVNTQRYPSHRRTLRMIGTIGSYRCTILGLPPELEE